MKLEKAQLQKIYRAASIFLLVQLLLLLLVNTHLWFMRRHFRADVKFHETQIVRIPERRADYAGAHRYLGTMAMTNASISNLVFNFGYDVLPDPFTPGHARIVLSQRPPKTR